MVKSKLVQGGDGTAIPSGFVGEVITASLAYASKTSLTNNTSKTLTSIPLGVGTWSISGGVTITLNSASSTQMWGCFSATTNAKNTSAIMNPTATGELSVANQTPIATGSLDVGITIPSITVTLSAAQTHYLVAECSFSGTGASASGFIRATRIA